MKKYFFKIRCAAIILIAAGYGWAGGHYIPPNSPIQAYIFEFIIIAALLITGIRSLSVFENEKNKSSWPFTTLSIFSILLLLINILNIIHRGGNFTSIFFSSRNTVADLVPVALLIIGNILWVITILQNTRHDSKAGYLFKSQYNIL